MKRLVLATTLALCTTTVGFTNYSVKHISKKQLACLKANIFHEARGESLEGMIAVAIVTLNRANYNFSSVCSTVFKRGQFSWTYSKSLETFQDSEDLSSAAYAALLAPQSSIIFYHSRNVKPYWAKDRTYIKTINNHVFYE